MLLVSGRFSSVKINVFRPFSFFPPAFRLKMNVRCDNQYQTEANGGTVLGQPVMFERMGICDLSPARESEMGGYLVYLLIVKYLSILFKYSHSVLD